MFQVFRFRGSELAAERPRVPTAGDPAKSGWYIADFRAEALVSAELVVVDDFITVVATVDELDRLFMWWAAAPSEDDTSQVSVEVLSGGTLSPDERLTRAGAGRSTYVSSANLKGVPDPGALAVARLLEGLA